MKNWAKVRASEFRSAWWIIGAANEPSGCVEFCDQIVHKAHLHSTYTRTCATSTRAVHAARHMANGRPTSLVRREKSPPPSNIYKETFSGKKIPKFSSLQTFIRRLSSFWISPGHLFVYLNIAPNNRCLGLCVHLIHKWRCRQFFIGCLLCLVRKKKNRRRIFSPVPAPCAARQKNVIN